MKARTLYPTARRPRKSAVTGAQANQLAQLKIVHWRCQPVSTPRPRLRGTNVRKSSAMPRSHSQNMSAVGPQSRTKAMNAKQVQGLSTDRRTVAETVGQKRGRTSTTRATREVKKKLN